jgi:hypothetical protein
MTVVAGLVLAGRTVSAESPSNWEVGAHGTGQVNPSDTGQPTFGAGFSLTALRAISPSGQIGARIDALWMLPDDDSYEYDATELDVVFVGRHRFTAPGGFDLHGELGAGVARYAGKVDIPMPPPPEMCWGCGRYGDSTIRPIIQGALTGEWPLGGALHLQAGARTSLLVIAADHTDSHNFLPAPLALRLDLGLGTRF